MGRKRRGEEAAGNWGFRPFRKKSTPKDENAWGWIGGGKIWTRGRDKREKEGDKFVHVGQRAGEKKVEGTPCTFRRLRKK